MIGSQGPSPPIDCDQTSDEIPILLRQAGGSLCSPFGS